MLTLVVSIENAIQLVVKSQFLNVQKCAVTAISHQPIRQPHVGIMRPMKLQGSNGLT